MDMKHLGAKGSLLMYFSDIIVGHQSANGKLLFWVPVIWIPIGSPNMKTWLLLIKLLRRFESQTTNEIMALDIGSWGWVWDSINSPAWDWDV